MPTSRYAAGSGPQGAGEVRARRSAEELDIETPPPKRILVIEDDCGVARMVQAILLSADPPGYSVDLAANGHEGLKKLADGAFDLVLTDILMPDMDGIEAILAIRRGYPTLPIVAVSGGGSLNYDFLGAAETFGAQRTLAKPFLPGDLLAAISEALGVGVEPRTAAGRGQD